MASGAAGLLIQSDLRDETAAFNVCEAISVGAEAGWPTDSSRSLAGAEQSCNMASIASRVADPSAVRGPFR